MKKIKRLFCLALLLITTYLTSYSQIFKYSVSGSEVTITGFADDFTVPENYDLVIPDEIEGKKVTKIGNAAFLEKTTIKTIAIGSQITEIGAHAFRLCENVTAVTFNSQDNLKKIGKLAFGKNKFETLTIPRSVTLIEDAAFVSCPNLISVEFKGSPKMEMNAFSSCPNLISVEFKGNVPAFDTYGNVGDAYAIFKGCDKLESIIVPLEYLDDYVSDTYFKNCTTTRNITLIKSSYTLPASGIGTFSTGVAATLPEGLEAYYCTDYDGDAGTIRTTLIEGTVPASTGVLLRGEGGETYTISASAETPAAIEGNALVAITEPTEVDATADGNTNFILSSGEFYKLSGTGTIAANRSYLSLPLQSPSQKFTLLWPDNDDPTGINAREKITENREKIYDLFGRRVTTPQRGNIYIVNGKKVSY